MSDVTTTLDHEQRSPVQTREPTTTTKSPCPSARACSQRQDGDLHNVLFLVHDMGRHLPGWSSAPGGPVDTLNRLSLLYPEQFGGRRFDELVECVEICYGELTEAIFQDWRCNRAPMPEDRINVSQHEDLICEIHSRLRTEHSIGDRRPNVDALLYAYFESSRWQIRALVVDQLAAQLSRLLSATTAQRQACRLTVVAHGLGTIVTHDALQILSAQGSPELYDIPAEQNTASETGLSRPAFNLAGVFMLANLSDMLRTEFSPYRSAVRPGFSRSNSVKCSSYFNIRHEMDPISYPRLFDPEGWDHAYFPITLRRFQHSDIHSLEHHLLHPRVHIPIFNLSIGRRVFDRTDSTAAHRLQTFPEWQARINHHQALDLKARLQKMISRLGSTFDALQWLKVTDEYYDLVEALHERSLLPAKKSVAHLTPWNLIARRV